ncbi:MAG: GTPase [Acetobacteraceae bacterium]
MDDSLFTSDLTALFVASTAAELAPVDLALRAVWPPYADDPAVRESGGRLDRCPHILAEAVAHVVRAHTADLELYGDVQADLAAFALVQAGQPLPEAATVPDLEAAVLDHAAGADELGQIAVAVARLRQRKLRRAAWLRLPTAAPLLQRVQKPQAEGIRRVEQAFDAVWAAARQTRLLHTFETIAAEEWRKLGRVNILIAGRSGVGKSTLINAVFGAEVAKVGQGRPVTQDITWFEPPGLPARLCDTKGLELAAFDETLRALEQEIERCNASGRFEDRIHILWLCVDEPGTRVQDGELRVAALCADHGIPTIVVLTKAIGPRNFQETVRAAIPGASHIVRVLAEPWDERAAFGLPDLIRVTEAVLPEAAKAAFEAAQQVDIERKRARALKIATGAASAAAGAAAVPIPLADAAGVFSVNVGMVAGIAAAMGVPMTRENMLTLGASMVGALAAAAGGRMIAGEILKLIPGVGAITGGVITAGIAGSATYGLGFGFTEFLSRYHARVGRMPQGEELREGFKKFWETWNEKEKKPPALG